MARSKEQSKQHILDTLNANGGTMSRAALGEQLQSGDFKMLNRMRVTGELHNFWVTENVGDAAQLHISTEPRANVTASEDPAPQPPPAQ